MKYINPVCKVLSLSTKRATLEQIIPSSYEEQPYEVGDRVNEMRFDDAVDDLFK